MPTEFHPPSKAIKLELIGKLGVGMCWYTVFQLCRTVLIKFRSTKYKYTLKTMKRLTVASWSVDSMHPLQFGHCCDTSEIPAHYSNLDEELMD